MTSPDVTRTAIRACLSVYLTIAVTATLDAFDVHGPWHALGLGFCVLFCLQGIQEEG